MGAIGYGACLCRAKAWAVWLLVTCLALPMAARAADRPPNIVFVIADDMRPWAMNFMLEDGAERTRFMTPNLDRLADESAR